MEGSQVTDLMSTIHRLEAKLDVAITQTQATVAEQGRLIVKLDTDVTGVVQRVTALETVGAATALHLATLDRTTDKPRSSWQATLGTIITALTFAALIFGLLYLGPGAAP